MEVDIVVIGAGTVGAAIAYGFARLGQRALVLADDDRDFRAAVTNFGLIWQSGKGVDMPAYQWLTRGSVERWPSNALIATRASLGRDDGHAHPLRLLAVLQTALVHHGELRGGAAVKARPTGAANSSSISRAARCRLVAS